MIGVYECALPFIEEEMIIDMQRRRQFFARRNNICAIASCQGMAYLRAIV